MTEFVSHVREMRQLVIGGGSARVGPARVVSARLGAFGGDVVALAPKGSA
ncbi:hypothetical protein [Streptomyces malaysiensis]|nr:hypothetical protein [Streptomyces sp. SPMA113]